MLAVILEGVCILTHAILITTLGYRISDLSNMFTKLDRVDLKWKLCLLHVHLTELGNGWGLTTLLLAGDNNDGNPLLSWGRFHDRYFARIIGHM